MKGTSNKKNVYKQKVSRRKIDTVVLPKIIKQKSAKWDGTLKIRRKFQLWKATYIYMERWFNFRSLGKALSILKSKILKLLGEHGSSSDFTIPVIDSVSNDSCGQVCGDIVVANSGDVNNKPLCNQGPVLAVVPIDECASSALIPNDVLDNLRGNNYCDTDFVNILSINNESICVDKSLLDASFVDPEWRKCVGSVDLPEIQLSLNKKVKVKAKNKIPITREMKEVWCYLILQNGPYCAFITINPREGTSDKDAKMIANVAIGRANKQLFGDNYRKNGKYIEGVVFPERHIELFRKGELHYHLLIKCPPGINPREFYLCLERCFWSAVSSMENSKSMGRFVFAKTFDIRRVYEEVGLSSYGLKGLEQGTWERKDEIDFLTIDGVP